MPTVADLKKHLNDHYKDTDHIAYSIWQVDDVHTTAECKGVDLNNEQANDVLDYVNSHEDCELGLSWTTVSCAIDNILEQK